MSTDDSLSHILSPQNGMADNALLGMLFDRMPMGLLILDTQLRIQQYNPTWEEFSNKYTSPNAKPLQQGMKYFDRFPGAEPSTLEYYQRVLQGKTIQANGERFETEGVISYWDIVLTPIYVQEKIVGILIVTTDVNERMRLQQNLEQRVEDRTQESERRRKVAESMRDIIRMINTSMPLEEFLDEAVVLAAEQMGASACILHEFNVTEREITIRASHGMEGIFGKGTIRRREELRASGADHYFEATIHRKATAGNYSELDDRGRSIIKADPNIPEHLKTQRITLRTRFTSVLSVPLFIQDRPFGGMVFYYVEAQDFTEEQINLGKTFADQVAIAIENTRLMEEAEKAAINEERHRLARDLHDAVTQTLFSSSLIADVLPKIWERDPEEGQRRLEELRQLTRGALSEMRTLLVELRPAAMEDTNLGDLLGHLVNAFIAKSRIKVNFVRNTTNHNPPTEIKEMFYRVAQENFNNIAKHAHANNAVVELTSDETGVVLIIRDDGVGFNSANPEHIGFGLKIMRERAQSVNAHFNLQSTIGTGTIMTVTWQNPEYEERKNE